MFPSNQIHLAKGNQEGYNYTDKSLLDPSVALQPQVLRAVISGVFLFVVQDVWDIVKVFSSLCLCVVANVTDLRN